MSNTTFIKTVIEPQVRTWMSTQFAGHRFAERQVTTASGGHYKFDAVSDDDSIVGAILCNRAKTRTGRENTGGVRKAVSEAQTLGALPPTIVKVMVFTDTKFRDLVARRTRRHGGDGIKMIVCTLPEDTATMLQAILDSASMEQKAADNPRTR